MAALAELCRDSFMEHMRELRNVRDEDAMYDYLFITRRQDPFGC